jgi:hypothetical protein
MTMTRELAGDRPALNCANDEAFASQSASHASAADG